MSRPGGNPNLKGKKGRSGRKSLQEEAVKALVMKKAWGKVLKKLTNLDDKEIEKYALQIVLRDIPKEVKGNLGLKLYDDEQIKRVAGEVAGIGTGVPE